MRSNHLSEPDADRLLDGDEQTIECAICDFETNRPERHHGRLICERCLNELLDVQQSIEADRHADEDEEGYGFGV